MNGGAKREIRQQEKSRPWVGFVQLGIICATIIAVVWIIWGSGAGC